MTRRRWLVGLLALGVASVVLVAALLNTTWGLGVALRAAATFTGAELRAQNLEGNLLDGARASAFEISLPGLETSIEDLDARWKIELSPLAFRLAPSRIASLRVKVEPSVEESEPLDELPVLDLPLRVDVERLEVARLQVAAGEGRETLAYDLAVAFCLVDGVLDIRDLSAAMDPVTVAAESRIDTSSRYRHHLQINAVVDDHPLHVELEGDLHETLLSAEGRDWGTRIEGRLLDVMDHPGADVSIRTEQDDLAAELQVEGTWPAFAITGEVSPGETSIELREGKLEIVDGVIELAAQVSLAEAGVEIQVESAQVDFEGDGQVAAVTTWEWAGPGSGPLGRSGGRLELAGDFRSVRARGEGTLPIRAKPFELALDADVGTEGAEIRQAALEGQGMSLALGGRLDWSEDLSMDLSGKAQGLDPALFYPDLPASIDVAIEARGNVDSLEIRLDHLAGRLLDKPLRGEGRVVLESWALAHSTLQLESGESRIELEAPSWPERPLRAVLDLENLGNLHPDLGGSLQGDALVTYHDDGFEAEATLEGHALTWQDWSLTSLEGRTSLDLRPAGELAVDLYAQEIAGPLALAQVQLQARGRDRVMDFETTMSSEISDLAGSGRMELGDPLQLYLRELELATRDFGHWELTETPRLTLAEARPHLDPAACILGDDARICIDLPDSEEIPGHFVLERFPVALLDHLAAAASGRTVRLSGRLDGELQWRLVEDRPSFEGQLAGADIEISVGTEGKAPEQLVLTLLELRAQGEQDLDLDVQLAAEKGKASLQGAVRGWTDLETATLDLRLDADLPDLAELGLLVPALEDLGGAIDANVTARGHPRDPRLTGEAKLSALRFRYPDVGLRVEEGELDLAFDDQGRTQVVGRLQLGEGSVRIEGQARSTDLQADLQIVAERALFLDLPDAQIRGNADLELRLDRDGIDLRGQVGVLESQVLLGPTQPTVRPSPDVVFVDAPPEEEAALDLPLRADLQVEILESVAISGFGLDARVRGRVRLQESPRQSPTASGNLEIVGTYDIYGQKLDIDRGRILFASSSVTDPLLDIEATRETESARVGVRVAGPTTQPTVTLFSNPQLPESDVLSLLIFGYALSDPNQQEAGALSAALMGLRMTTSNLRSDEPGVLEKLGFTDVGVDVRSDLGGAAFSLGRYLTPKLYVGYSIGLREAIDVISLRYELTDRWTIGAEAGDETRARITYRVETGQARVYEIEASGKELAEEKPPGLPGEGL